MKIYTSDQLIAALKEAGFTEIKTYSNTKNHWISIVATKQPISGLLGSRRERKIGIYRKCDKKAKTVYWEKRLRKE